MEGTSSNYLLTSLKPRHGVMGDKYLPVMPMVGMLVPLKGGIGSIFHPPEGKDYKWYISGIYCQLGEYMLPTTC